jgi:Subtilase family
MPSKGKTTGSKHPPSGPGGSEAAGSPRELIVIAKPDVGLRASALGITALAADESSLATILEEAGAVMRPLFGPSEERVRAATDAPRTGDDEGLPAAWDFYHVEADDETLDELAAQLYDQELVEAAYVKPAGQLPTLVEERRRTAAVGAAINDMQPQLGDAPPTTPDFVSRQGYLDAAPGGIDARYAWTVSGGGGAGVRIIDCEWGWRFTHEDLIQNQGGIVAGSGISDTDHGTAVLGEISGDRNSFGITGIVPDAMISASAFSVPSATAIRSAADRLGSGDIILLEIHRPGPRPATAAQPQFGYIAIEWWPDDFAAIRYAVNKGIIVVEAAGNGFQNLDDSIYDQRPAGFPTSWTNPFNPQNPSSGAVLVGAGAPPSGNWGTDRSRLDFSNYGARVDAQGWGREVTSTGYGDLQGGTNQDLWYTSSFSGTSSASPIVVGALACLQGAVRGQGRPPIGPARARDLLRSTGSPQQDTPGRPATQRIGNRPNLRQLVAAATQTVAPWTGVQFTGQLAANATACWFTFNWPAYWHVVWTVIPTTVAPGAPQIRWQTRVERSSDGFATYWICVTNLTTNPVSIEGRYGVLGW